MAANTKKAKKKSPTKQKAKKKSKKFQPDKKQLLLLIAAAAVIIALILCAVFIKGSAYKKTEITALGDSAWGIDVSSHNGKIDWKKVKKEADFAFIRVGYRGYGTGEINADKTAKANMKGAVKNDLPIGVYFYSQAVNEKEAKEEAKFVLSRIKNYPIALPVVIDFEYAFKDDKQTGRLWEAKLSRKEETALVNAFCDTIREAGYTPGIYASSYIYRSHFIIKSIPKDVFIWVADYNEKVTYEGDYDIWQYSENGTCKGVSSDKVDVNYFYTNKRVQ